MDDRVVVDRFLLTSWLKFVLSVVKISVDVGVLDGKFLSLLLVGILFELFVAPVHHSKDVVATTVMTFGCV